MSNPSSVYSDFCQAWVSRFPHSDLPAAWEEDVRANLKKHKSKVAVLREELEKEEMYVEYLDKLLGDIEAHRKLNPVLGENGDNSVDALNTENKRRSASDISGNGVEDALATLSDQPQQPSPGPRDRAQLRLDLGGDEGGGAQQTEFVTVINVPAAKGGGSSERPPPPEAPASLSSFKKVPPRPPPKRTASRDSLNSVSSPTTPSSAHLLLLEEDDLENPRESLLSPSSKDLASTSRDSSEEQDEDFEFRGWPDGEDQHQKQQPLQKRRPQLQQHPKVNKIKELMANWESGGGGSRPRSLQQPTTHADKELVVRARASSLKTSDRGRMGSPSGKSHESSDGENNWPLSSSSSSSAAVIPAAGAEQQQQHQQIQKTQSQGGGSPGGQRRRRLLPSTSGETRLDRLVRRPSGERSSPGPPGRHSEALPVPPPVPKPMKKPRAKPRSQVGASVGEELSEEPLYDTVANEEPEDEYDNHLLYGTNSTTKSGGSSSADLGFDEPKHHHHNSLAKSAQSGLSGSGTLSSSETDKSASLKRGMSLPEEEEEESNYVNIQYFLQAEAASSRGKQSTSSSTNILDTIQSDEELDKEEDLSSSAEILNEESESEASSAASEADRVLMYKSILNSIVDSEAAYLECLSVVLQYMKAMKVTLTTSQPVIPKEEFDVIFYKIPELHDLHFTFHESLKQQVAERREGESGAVGHTFKMLASRTKIYAAFLANYRKALDALRRCSGAYPQFADLTRSIKLRNVKGQQQQGQSLSLEDLLHKPVARIQKLSLGLQDLLRYAAAADRAPIGDALRQMRDFVGEYNSLHDGAAGSNELLFPPTPQSLHLNQASDLATQQLVQAQQQQRRHLVKNSFIVELHEGARKLRHLFLFNDVLVCAKYKASSKRTEKFTFLLKWHIPLYNVSVVIISRSSSVRQFVPVIPVPPLPPTLARARCPRLMPC